MKNSYDPTNYEPVKSQYRVEPKVRVSPPISLDKGGMKIIWTGAGYYKKFEWKGVTLYHRNMKAEGNLYRDKPQNTDDIHVVDMTLYTEKATLESILKHQLLDDFRSIGIKVTQDMIDWADYSHRYGYQFFPALQGEQIVALQKSDWRGCVWACSHHTIVTIHPRLTEILYSD